MCSQARLNGIQPTCGWMYVPSMHDAIRLYSGCSLLPYLHEHVYSFRFSSIPLALSDLLSIWTLECGRLCKNWNTTQAAHHVTTRCPVPTGARSNPDESLCRCRLPRPEAETRSRPLADVALGVLGHSHTSCCRGGR